MSTPHGTSSSSTTSKHPGSSGGTGVRAEAATNSAAEPAVHSSGAGVSATAVSTTGASAGAKQADSVTCDCDGSNNRETAAAGVGEGASASPVAAPAARAGGSSTAAGASGSSKARGDCGPLSTAALATGRCGQPPWGAVVLVPRAVPPRCRGGSPATSVDGTRGSTTPQLPPCSSSTSYATLAQPPPPSRCRCTRSTVPLTQAGADEPVAGGPKCARTGRAPPATRTRSPHTMCRVAPPRQAGGAAGGGRSGGGGSGGGALMPGAGAVAGGLAVAADGGGGARGIDAHHSADCMPAT